MVKSSPLLFCNTSPETFKPLTVPPMVGLPVRVASGSACAPCGWQWFRLRPVRVAQWFRLRQVRVASGSACVRRGGEWFRLRPVRVARWFRLRLVLGGAVVPPAPGAKSRD